MDASHKGIIIAMDGPAGSGKSTAARKLAEAEGLIHLNTGAMYRAVAHLVNEGGFDAENNPDSASRIAHEMEFHYDVHTGKQHFIVAAKVGSPKEDLTEKLFTASLTKTLKPIVVNQDVRAALVDKMRTAAFEVLDDGARGVVLEGRDIGTVVFPDAFIKFFLHADLDERTRRRAAELKAKGESVDLEGLKEQIKRRDDIDSTREVGPLKKADDAIDVDTSHLDPEATLKRLREELAHRRVACGSKP